MALVAGCMMASFAADAQQPGHKRHHDFDPDKMARHQTERMKTDLTLNDQQVSQVESINLKYARKKKELKEEMRKQMKSMEQDKQKELEGVLTGEQMDKYKKTREERHAHKHSHKGKMKR